MTDAETLCRRLAEYHQVDFRIGRSAANSPSWPAYIASFDFRPDVGIHRGCWIRKWGYTRKEAARAALETYRAVAELDKDDVSRTEVPPADGCGRRMLRSGSDDELSLLLAAAGK